MDVYLTSILRQETQAGPGERLSFSLQSEKTSRVCKSLFHLLSSMSHFTAAPLCGLLPFKMSPPSQTLCGSEEPALKATCALKAGRFS